MAGHSPTPRGVRLRGDKIEINFSWNARTRYVVVPGLPATAKGIKQAAALREVIKREIELGIFQWSTHFPDHKLAKAEMPKATGMTVEDLLNRWLDTQEGILSPRYYKNSKYRVESILIPAFGHIPISMLAPGHIRDWASKQNTSRKTTSNYLMALRSAIREAINDGVLTESPLKGLVLPKEKAEITKRIEQKREQVTPYSREEIDRLLEHCHYDSERNLFQFAAWSGVRPGELIALEWRHVDLKKGTAFICQAISDKTMSDIKTRAKGRREIMLLPAALEAIQRQREISQLSKHGRVFVNRERQPFVDYNALQWSFHYACKRADVTKRGVGQTRHTFASWMLMNGEDEAWVAKMLGHTTVEMIRKHYRKFIKDDSSTGYTLKADWGQKTPQNLAKTWQKEKAKN
ncbi:site-specific integrase [uncultured Endozoicomonas sp.]|uniref:site-specific integrase n=1 Tax=uncultured Endozoicomonas sp. TaxID=432652 RepID=UPI00263747C6|nr:site-specific integrase [uncultured Endozoicomonas sp.]